MSVTSPHELSQRPHIAGSNPAGPDQTRDPVCGMVVEPGTAKFQVEHAGAMTYFCSERCKSRFLADPAKYLTSGADAGAPHPATPSGVVYTCPMHPQIRRDGPGSCPICGMTLEPLNAENTSAVSPELRDMTRRFWIGTALTTPMLVLEMGAHLSGLNLHHYVSAAQSMWIQLVLGTPVVRWAGWPFFERAWTSVLNRSLNMFSLIGLGISAAYLYSLAATFAPGLFPSG